MCQTWNRLILPFPTRVTTYHYCQEHHQLYSAVTFWFFFFYSQYGVINSRRNVQTDEYAHGVLCRMYRNSFVSETSSRAPQSPTFHRFLATPKTKRIFLFEPPRLRRIESPANTSSSAALAPFRLYAFQSSNRPRPLHPRRPVPVHGRVPSFTRNIQIDSFRSEKDYRKRKRHNSDGRRRRFVSTGSRTRVTSWSSGAARWRRFRYVGGPSTILSGPTSMRNGDVRSTRVAQAKIAFVVFVFHRRPFGLGTIYYVRQYYAFRPVC